MESKTLVQIEKKRFLNRINLCTKVNTLLDEQENIQTYAQLFGHMYTKLDELKTHKQKVQLMINDFHWDLPLNIQKLSLFYLITSGYHCRSWF